MAVQLAPVINYISPEEYLEWEKLAETKHEYVGGHVYAMAGASDDHNRIARNILIDLGVALRGKRCEPFGSDMKLRMPDDEAFYYPDVLVACDPRDNAQYYRERPLIVFEVLSPDTAKTDQREKRYTYGLVPGLKTYVIVAQDRVEVTVLRRGRWPGWKEQVITGLNEVLNLPEIKLAIPLKRIYERTRVGRTK
jgi:Uma2 family endonuclease